MRAAIALIALSACVSPTFEEGYRCPMGLCPPGQMCGDDGVCRSAPAFADGAGTSDSPGGDGVASDGSFPDALSVDGALDSLGCLDGEAPTGCVSPVRFTCPGSPGGCYVLCQDRLNYGDAANACSTWPGGGHLAVMDSQLDSDCVDEQTSEAVWIGLRQNPAETIPTTGWNWEPAVSTYFGGWDTGEPMDGDGNEDHNEDCGLLGLNGLWQDLQCGPTVQYVCER